MECKRSSGARTRPLMLRVYQHLIPDDVDPLAARMDEVFREATQNFRGLTAAWS